MVESEVKTTVAMSAELRQWWKAKARSDGRTMAGYLIFLLNEARDKDTAKAERLMRQAERKLRAQEGVGV